MSGFSNIRSSNDGKLYIFLISYFTDVLLIIVRSTIIDLFVCSDEDVKEIREP